MSENESPSAEETAATVAQWLETAFPGHRCPKCGNQKFYVLDPPPQPLAEGDLTYSKWPIAKIACAKCGFIEEHLTGVLKKTLEETNFAPLAPEQPNE